MDRRMPPFGLPGTMDALRGAREQGRRTSGFAAQDLFWIALAGSIAGFVLLVFRPNRERIRAGEAECRLLRSEIGALESEVSRLRSWQRSLAAEDAEAWIAVARERLGWVGPGERLMRPAVRRSVAAPDGDVARLPRSPGGVRQQ